VLRDPARELALVPTRDHEPVSIADRLAARLLDARLDDWADPAVRSVREALYEAASDEGHKVGGWPGFTQCDQRDPDDDSVLLFQLDSQSNVGIMWGELGVGNFFVRPKDLAERDFSRVGFRWDSG
jgi:uncharacterized protein YwqG